MNMRQHLMEMAFGQPVEVPDMVRKGHAALVQNPLTPPCGDQIKFDILNIAIMECAEKMMDWRMPEAERIRLVATAEACMKERDRLLYKHRNTVML